MRNRAGQVADDRARALQNGGASAVKAFGLGYNMCWRRRRHGFDPLDHAALRAAEVADSDCVLLGAGRPPELFRGPGGDRSAR
jgi:hypothetical protein